MKQIKLKSMHLENFKGCKQMDIAFGDITHISGANATGKTTIFDGFTWLLFGRDSLGSTTFDVRPLEDGKMVNNVEICVEAEIEVDGVTYVLKKVQKQKWVKKRGTDTREFQGNINEFEINGYPKREKEFKEFISSIIDEKLFNLVTNPNAFTSLPWREQREMIMNFIKEISDKELAEKNGFAELVPELSIATTDDIRKKYTKAKNELNKQMVEIPARIDEASKQISKVNVSELENQKASLHIKLNEIEDELNGSGSRANEIGKRQEEILKIRFDMSAIAQKANEAINKKKYEAMERVNEASAKVRDAESEVSRISIAISTAEKKRDDANFEKGLRSTEWKREKVLTFPEYRELDQLSPDALICPTCGRDLPEDQKEKIVSEFDSKCRKHREKWESGKKKFESEHQKKIKEIIEQGQKAADDVRKYDGEVQKLKADLENAKERTIDTRKALADAKAIYEDLNSQKVVYPDSYAEMATRVSDLEKEIKNLNEADSGKIELEAKKKVLSDMIAQVDAKIARADNTEIKHRIAELEEEKKEVGQKIANTEKKLQMLEDFIRMKMDNVSSTVNRMFEMVSFKLFDNQINGGVSETCECTYNGVPYSSLNNGHKIIAGMDIIHSLMNLYEVNCPVFIDNAEAISYGNMPDIGCQMILLEVSNDRELKVEELR